MPNTDILTDKTFGEGMDKIIDTIKKGVGGGGGTPLPENVISNTAFTSEVNSLVESIEAGTGVNVAEEVKQKLGTEAIRYGQGDASSAINVIGDRADNGYLPMNLGFVVDLDSLLSNTVVSVSNGSPNSPEPNLWGFVITISSNLGNTNFVYGTQFFITMNPFEFRIHMRQKDNSVWSDWKLISQPEPVKHLEIVRRTQDNMPNFDLGAGFTNKNILSIYVTSPREVSATIFKGGDGFKYASLVSTVGKPSSDYFSTEVNATIYYTD